MHKHGFLFESSYWIGEGKIAFSSSLEHMRFYTSWQVAEKDSTAYQCLQQVEMQGSEELVTNRFEITNITDKTFDIELENELVGKVEGRGVIDAKTIAWEFRGSKGIEGFEVYELQENGDYMFHAEYVSSDQFRTIIDGRIWKKET